MAAAPAHLFIDAQHGLCNRLRAIASAAVIAKATGRQLVVVWRTDPHCQARLADLLDYPGPVIEDDSADSFRARATRVYNDMEVEAGSAHGAAVLDGTGAEGADPGGDIYIRSAYSLTSQLTSMAQEQAFLRRLVPSKPVWDLVQSVRHPSDVAAHIRMATGPAFDHLPHESPENWPVARHWALVEGRRKSDVSRFADRLTRAFAEGASHAFVAADLPATYAELSDRFGRKLRFLPRNSYDRSAGQLQYALADLMLLTAAPLLLASHFSSFSDVAQRLSRPFHRVERSGIEF